MNVDNVQSKFIALLEKAISEVKDQGFTFLRLGQAELFCNKNYASVEINLNDGIYIKHSFLNKMEE